MKWYYEFLTTSFRGLMSVAPKVQEADFFLALSACVDVYREVCNSMYKSSSSVLYLGVTFFILSSNLSLLFRQIIAEAFDYWTSALLSKRLIRHLVMVWLSLLPYIACTNCDISSNIDGSGFESRSYCERQNDMKKKSWPCWKLPINICIVWAFSSKGYACLFYRWLK